MPTQWTPKLDMGAEIARLYTEGNTPAQIAEKVHRDASTVYRWLRTLLAEGKITPTAGDKAQSA